MSLKNITELSTFFGLNPDYVLGGGGNTSFKDENFLYVKPSGISLASITEKDFVKMEREKVRAVFAIGELTGAVEREAIVKKMLADAVTYDSSGRPSVEAPLHELIPTAYVVHLHPAAVNGMTCGKNGKEICEALFPEALWIDYIDPGFTLAYAVYHAARDYKQTKGRDPQVIFLQNHGVFVGANEAKDIRSIYQMIMDTLAGHYQKQGVALKLETGEKDTAFVFENAPMLRSLLGSGAPATVISLPPFKAAGGALTPDHIVYAKSFCLETENPNLDAVAAFEARHGYKPKVVSVPGKAVFCAADTYKDALTVAGLAADAAKVQAWTAAFGGCLFMSDKARGFIENWEVESYRKQVSSGKAGGRLRGKIAVITGGAQGFGFGIAEELAAEGALAVIADMNRQGAEGAAAVINSKFGSSCSIALEVNISSEESVEKMVRELVERCGGIDILVANAGVLRAGSVKTMTLKDWEFVTDINYTGYFLCTKHVSPVMALQNKHGGGWTDIVQINSKSGLCGSNRNGAYAGSKFGTIGLTQSFAMELVEDRIKVNSICPGNFFDGPLWSDPEKGLFVQYLNSGKVPGAMTIGDVKAFYEAKVPMNRGCFPADVAKAIIYVVEQKYETGQAIPVTGGQVMLS
ncbi:MAG: SDR family NAD(P)-dependent oxidoreductase [Victivallaceae bacterium]|jgi:NAD(P)-dependent dehydrogenase (short-subunit alcohol dehydrogenase family)/rhamnose utilization protein RhaD (predicted bifunctional aldolase and dehydrogenase)